MGKYSEFTKERFAEKLEYYRKAKGLTRAELAQKTNMSPPAITYYERGERDPKLSVFCDLANALNLDDPILFFVNDGVSNLLKNNDYLFSDNKDVVSGDREQLISEMAVKARSLTQQELLALNIIIDSMTGHNKLL